VRRWAVRRVLHPPPSQRHVKRGDRTQKRQKIAIVIKDINLTYTLLVLLSFLSNFTFRPSIDTVFFHIVKFPFEHLLGLSLSPYIDVIRLDLGGVRERGGNIFAFNQQRCNIHLLSQECDTILTHFQFFFPTDGNTFIVQKKEKKNSRQHQQSWSKREKKSPNIEKVERTMISSRCHD
jgi:hypothetical protein